MLAPQQNRVIERLRSTISNCQEMPSVIFIGTSGTGKRTLAQGLALALGLNFTEVPLIGSSDDLKMRLFGNENEAKRSREEHTPPGQLGFSSGVVFLSHFEQLPTNMHHCVHSLLTTRTFVDAQGCKWSLHRNALLVGSLTTGRNDFTVSVSHWLPASFEHRIQTNQIASAQECREMTSCILASLGSIAEPEEDAISEMLITTRLATNGLHTIRECLVDVVAQAGTHDKITANEIRDAMNRREETALALMQASYRGRTISPQMCTSWLDQFQPEEVPYARHILFKLADRYYISERRYYDLIEKLKKQPIISPDVGITFCRWQMLGKSGDRVAHDIRNVANWRVNPEVDLRLDPTNWRNLAKDAHHTFILADDFVGTGQTLSRLVQGGNAGSINKLLTAFPHAHIWILILVGYLKGLRLIRNQTLSEPRIHLDVGIILDEEDRCLSETSSIFQEPSDRLAVRTICDRAKSDHYPDLANEFAYGYRELSSIVVFSNTVPNGSLPILWHTKGTWNPLCPAEGLPEEDLIEIREQRNQASVRFNPSV